MNVVFRTDDYPAAERLDRLHELAARLLAPIDLRIDQEADLRAEVGATSLGAVCVFTADTTPFEVRRTAKLVRQTDRELYVLVLGVGGLVRVVQDQREAAIGPGALTLYDASRPFRGWVGVDGAPAKLVALAFPHTLLPLHPDTIRRLIAVRLSGCSGIGALVARFVADLARQAAIRRLAVAAHLATAALDLLAALLTDAVETAALPPQTHRRALLFQIHAFIQQRLGDPALSPEMIAAAHHISARHLHRLFREQGTTVAGWIRGCRLDHCRRDLADPGLASWSIRAIASRWGLVDGAHFSRAFRSAFGLSPRDYRQVHQELSQDAC